MTDIRRTLLWVVFTMSLVLFWDAWNKHTGQPSMFGGTARPAASASAPDSGAPSVALPVPAAVPEAAGAVATAGSAATVLEKLAPAGVPRIYFALDSNHLLEAIRTSGADVIGADWRLPLHTVSGRLGGGFPLQGNLDPCVLLAPPEVVEGRARQVLEHARGLRGHIFNLGHGVLPATPIANVETVVATVRAGV